MDTVVANQQRQSVLDGILRAHSCTRTRFGHGSTAKAWTLAVFDATWPGAMFTGAEGHPLVAMGHARLGQRITRFCPSVEPPTGEAASRSPATRDDLPDRCQVQNDYSAKKTSIE